MARRIHAIGAFLALAMLCLPPAGIAQAPAKPWLDAALPVARRVNLLLAQMTLTEKLQMLHGAGSGIYDGAIPAIPRLGVPAFRREDA